MCFYRISFCEKGWKVYDLETGDIFISRDVIFHEDMFPFAAEVTNKESLMNFGRQDNVYLEMISLILGNV